MLSLIPAGGQKEYGENILKEGKCSALNGIAIYGANGGGKSNLLRAIGTMANIVRRSSMTSSTAKLPYDPFLLREGFAEQDTTFEILFVTENKRYRYGFSYNAYEVSKEWLFRKAVGRETSLFEREGDTVEVNSGLNGSAKLIDTAVEATRRNTLFLSMCDMLNVEEAKTIVRWFTLLNLLNGQHSQVHEVETALLLQDKTYAPKIEEYLKSVCLDIQGVEIQSKEFDTADLPTGMHDELRDVFSKQLKGSRRLKVLAQHALYDREANRTKGRQSWDWDDRESSGSQKAMHLSGPILWTLANGGVLVVDEIEAFLHPVMTLNTIEVFLDKRSNLRGAQLIFATHDTNLLSYARLRRDQIYFAEKNKWESTEIFSLSDFKYLGEKNGQCFTEKERPDADKEKRYIEGRYGAIPVLGEFNQFIRNLQWPNEEK